MELLGRFLAVSRLNYPTPAKSLQTPQQNETPRKRGVRQQSETAAQAAVFCICGTGRVELPLDQQVPLNTLAESELDPPGQ